MHPALLKILEGIEEEHQSEGTGGPGPVILSMEEFQKHMDGEMAFQDVINKIMLERPWDVCWTQSQRPQ